MKYLVYCIFLENKSARIDAPPVGVEGRPTYVVANNQLAAVISAYSDNELPRDYSTILTYHTVIESLHGQLDVVPLRFGTLLDQESEVSQLLAKHGERYKKLLGELNGCVEMGIRVILEEMKINAESYSETYGFSLPPPSGTGAAYLAGRKARYDEEALASEMEKEAIARYRTPFEGLFVNFKGQASKLPVPSTRPQTALLSLDFLVPRQSVGPFRKTYNHLKSGENAKMMLSGPWPPYSFVLPEDY